MINVYVDIDDSFIVAREWKSADSYIAGDRVYDNSSVVVDNLSPIYVCVIANLNSTPSSSNQNWILAGTSPEYPLLCRDPMDVDLISAPFEYEWSFDGSTVDNDPVLRHYRMIEEAGGGTVVFMFENFDSPHTSMAKQSQLRLIPGSLLSDATKITFDSYNKNTTITINGYGGNPYYGLIFGILPSATSLTDLRANNYYFNNLTFNITHSFSSLFEIAAGEFTGCKFIKTAYVGAGSSAGHRFHTNHRGSKVKAKFKSCLFEQSYGVGINGESTATEFISCTFAYSRFDQVTSYASASLGGMFNYTFKTFKDNIFYIKKVRNFDASETYPSNTKVYHNGVIYWRSNSATNNLAPGGSNDNWNVFNTDLSINATAKSGNVIYIEGYESDSSYSGISYMDPMLVDPHTSDYRLRPSSPLIGGLKSSNPAGVYIQPGSGTGGSGTFDDPYYMGELGVAETEAAAGEGIIYFVDGEYIVSADLNFYADEITYKSLNKHKAILGKNDAGTTSAVRINVGGAYGTTNLGVGNITLEDFYLKNSRFQLASNDLSRPNKLTGLKVIDTLPVTHATDGIIWSPSSACIIKSCFFYTDFGAEPNHYIGRGLSNIEVYDSTMIIKFSNTSGHIIFATFKSFENSIVYGTTAGIPESGFPAFTAASKDCCFHNIGSNSTYGGENTYQGDPKFVDASSKDFRLRADSPLIGGVNKSKYSTDSVWVQPGAGNGTGTEDDPFYWDEYSAAFLAATQSSSKQLIFKDGTYIWTSGILQDNNVGNGITLTAENMHQAIFTDSGRINSAGKDPTLRFKGIKLLAKDHFTHLPVCHYVFDSVHLLCELQVGALSVTATGSIFEVATGANTFIFNNSGPVNIRNCIFADHNDRSPSDIYLTHANSGIIKNTIFYAKYPRADCINPSHSAILMNCASENIVNQQSGIEYFNNLGFVDVENKNYNLRPLSPLIGKGK